MFSGLVREIAKVKSFQNNILCLYSSYTPKIGDSIAVNGACLSVISLFDQGFCVELTAHTQENIATENLEAEVHIEPALQIGDRLDGHFVQGHIDGIGTLTHISTNDNQTNFHIQVPLHLISYLIPKGSITIDGISLTITQVEEEILVLTLIPHTMQNTLFHTYKIGRRVNIESDMLVRSVAHFLQKTQGLQDWEMFDSFVMRY